MKQELLIVDDEYIILLMHKTIVVEEGLHESPHIIMDGELALEYIKDNDEPGNAYLVLLDINMPGMSGWAFLDAIQAQEWNSRIHVAILTSSVNASDRIKATEYPQVLAYIEKPLINRHIL
ncbi:MAG: response regulator, partial [Balneolales bacterium]